MLKLFIYIPIDIFSNFFLLPMIFFFGFQNVRLFFVGLMFAMVSIYVMVSIYIYI